ncbi:MAG: hypothetical protein ABI658_29700 [Acidimicrobiales bacterium]
MNGLERRYRMLLAIYPPEYLEQREEEMVAVLLASAHADQRRPAMKEAVGLVYSGLRARTAAYGRAERSNARMWSALVSAAALSALATLVLTVHATGTWSTERPRLFAPFWLAIAALPALVVFAPRVVRRLGVGPVAIAVAGLVSGRSVPLVQRTLLVAVVWFAFVVWLTPTAARISLRAASVIVGVGAGLAGAAKVHSAMRWSGPPAAYRAPARAGYVLQNVFQDVPTLSKWIWIPSLCVLVIAVCTKGTVAIIYGFVIVPLALAITALSSVPVLDSSLWGVQMFVEVPIVSMTVAGLAAILGTTLTMRSDHRAVDTTMR